MSEWISVKDSVPERYLRVIVCNSHKGVADGHLTGHKTRDGKPLWSTSDGRRSDITHWMPLPEAPAEDV